MTVSSSIRAPSMGRPSVAKDLLEHRAVEADQRQPVRRVLDQLQTAETPHRVHDVHQQRLGHRIPGVGHQCVDDLLRVVPAARAFHSANGVTR